MKKLNVKIILHHEPEEDADCDGDYCGASLIVDDKCVWQLGDDYHDKSDEKFEGYIQALKDMGFEVTETREHKADAEGWVAPTMEEHDLKHIMGD